MNQEYDLLFSQMDYLTF